MASQLIVIGNLSDGMKYSYLITITDLLLYNSFVFIER